ncbi:uncharacterized protein A4U43_C08F9990 [Asparagus officinalis]|nr:uncharacterized protein A4U43_C08F9990 [Asparagus officinalis]
MVERDYEEWDVHGKWGEVEKGEEEMGVVDELLHQLREVDPQPLDGGAAPRRKRRRRAAWESRREAAAERRRAKGNARRVGRRPRRRGQPQKETRTAWSSQRGTEQRRTHWMPDNCDGRSLLHGLRGRFPG